MGISIVEMGLVADIQASEKDKTAKIVIKPTNPGCMSAANMAMQARVAAENWKKLTKRDRN